jgi:transketolase
MLTTSIPVRENAVRTRAPYFRAESALVQPAALRRTILEQAHRAGVGHIGSALSIVEILAALFGHVLRGEPGDPDRDRFVLSKGHAALALYAALYEAGRLDRGALEGYCGDGTLLGTHPEHELDGVDFSTGSLGHGLSIGAGAALGARMQGSERRVFVLVSDAELNEGSLWEAAMFAAHHRLANLIAVVDANGQQALGYTREVLDLEPLPARFGAFGWDTTEVDGHDVDALATAFEAAGDRPLLVVARTTFGKGVSYMESLVKWHYWPMSDDDYERALAEVTA